MPAVEGLVRYESSRTPRPTQTLHRTLQDLYRQAVDRCEGITLSTPWADALTHGALLDTLAVDIRTLPLNPVAYKGRCRAAQLADVLGAVHGEDPEALRRVFRPPRG